MGTRQIIGYDKQLQGYFIYIPYKQNLSCDKCKAIVEICNFMAIHITQKHNQIVDSYFCLDCYKAMKPLSNNIDIFSLAFLVNVIGANYMIITDFEPFLKVGSITCWDVDKVEGIIVDNTKIADKLEYSKMDIPDRPQLQDFDKDLNKEIKSPEGIKKVLFKKPISKDFNLLDHILGKQPNWEDVHGNAPGIAIDDKNKKQDKEEDKDA